jgi:cation diffusion facilitator CzcD-associated flavoprotein CzcO
MTDQLDVAVVGAGPYGLSVAAHLSSAGIPYRQFGRPMSLWRTAMPQGMHLKSQGFASNLSDADGAKTLEAFCAATGRSYGSYGVPVPLDTFVEYGRWFARQLSLPVEESLVTEIIRNDRGFHVTIDDSERLTARAVVFAIGVEHFAHLPAPFSGLPPELCTHSSAHTDLAAFKGKQVIVIGAGQSALESAALLHEGGADVQVLAREPKLAWNSEPLSPDRPLAQRLREPEAGLGSGWATWFYSNHPDLFRRLPPATRAHRAATALGPAGACWLRVRVEGQFPVRCGHAVTAAKPHGDGVRLTVATVGTSTDGRSEELTADHVIVGTGYRPDLSRLGFIGADLRAELATLGGSVRVGRGYQSSVPGLYFVGPVVAPSFGPVMRFVYGAHHAAQAVTRQLVGVTGQPALAMTASR